MKSIKKRNKMSKIIEKIGKIPILAGGWAKHVDPQADTSALEGEIDQLVYQLYGLTEDDVKIVEGKE